MSGHSAGKVPLWNGRVGTRASFHHIQVERGRSTSSALFPDQAEAHTTCMHE